MKVIVCGAGQVGFNIAKQLAAEHNDVTVIDHNAELIRKISDTLDVQGMTGHAAHPDVLERAGASDADMIIAVTQNDEVNMIACQVAHSLFNLPMKVARIRTQAYLQKQWLNMFSRDHLPIDVIISPEVEVGRAVLRRLAMPGAFEAAPFADDRVMLMGTLLEENCPVVNTPLRQLTELFPDLNIIIAGVVRDGKLFIPRGDDQLRVGDQAYFISAQENVRRALDIFGHEQAPARRVIILGAGNIGMFVARELERANVPVRVKIIEYRKERAEAAADQLANTVVLHGDALDLEILREANIAEAETIIAVTDDDEVNILASVLAKQGGCQRAVALINNPGYGPLMRSLGIDVFIDPRATTVSKILQHVRRGRIRGLYSLYNGAAEVLEAEALETATVIGKPLNEAGIPRGIMIGAIVRGGKVIVPRGNTIIRTGDRVVILALAEMVKKVEQMFRVSLEYF
ncbi:MAG TPA: Trk system potassium transporter TrkA [Alphaproteobacteria bacterium]|nr:Trk system potassium transporter TrkA [Alphaproteobacteria bacterium]